MRDWLDHRTGFRGILKDLLEEPLPSGTGWWFVTGSIVMFLLTVQLVTGVLLAIFYSPSPDHAYDSIRFIMERVTFGRVLRGLHIFGASFIVIAAVVHMLRVMALGSYKKPRELNWVIGVLLLLIILGFALTGYLLPWDQKAYWATTVTLNIARSTPLVGNFVSGLLRGGTGLGALTLMRWYAAHVFLLPACLIAFTVAHIYLLRRHGISGPVKPVAGPATPFYPYHAIKDTISIAVVFALLLTCAVAFNAPLDNVADPTDATYVPRPEWYFMSLFELLKHFPGRLEPIATIVIPGVVVALLFLLPFIDTRPERAPRQRPVVIGSFIFVFAMITLLTVQGFRTTPSPAAQSPQAIAQGRARAAGQTRGPVMVEDVFKNVQVLKGITVDEFMGTMGLMSSSLGLCCNDCHPGAGTDKVVWESDENPRKVRAREMASMVQAINRDNFNGQQVVTCWTCHRLRLTPVQTPVLDRFYAEAGGELDGARIDAQLAFPANIAHALSGLRVGPVTELNGKFVYLLQGNGARGSFVSMYFDMDSGLLLRTIRYTPSKIGKVPTQVDYENWRVVNGIKFPFKWTFTWLDGRDSFDFTDVKFNLPIDQSKFGEPVLTPRPALAQAGR
ncbi:MAG: hypothetical protein DMF88_17100 [Acidobacteria bacterium]|nr:MAG: hypothetical protein DMF88_17100 [Acidobacteriota bacterium]